MSERWLPVVSFEGLYEVSDLGRVRSLDRRVPTRRKTGIFSKFYPGTVKAPTEHPHDDYLRLWLCRDGVVYPRTVHSIVADAFFGPRPPGTEVCHDDGNGHNNAALNLRYGSRASNREDSRRMGRLAVGERIPQHKLSTAQVVEIRASRAAAKSLSARFDVSPKQIRRVKNNEAWRHV